MLFDNVWADRVAKVLIVLALLVCIFIVTGMLMNVVLPADSEPLLLGEYLLDDGPIGVFFAGKVDNMKLYRMQDIETGASCYIIRSGNAWRPAISCVFDPLTPRG